MDNEEPKSLRIVKSTKLTVYVESLRGEQADKSTAKYLILGVYDANRDYPYEEAIAFYRELFEKPQVLVLENTYKDQETYGENLKSLILKYTKRNRADLVMLFRFVRSGEKERALQEGMPHITISEDIKIWLNK